MVNERHRHRYEFNNAYRAQFEQAGLVCSASPDGRLVEMIELPGHPMWTGTQAHPEFKSRPDRPHPLFSALKWERRWPGLKAADRTPAGPGLVGRQRPGPGWLQRPGHRAGRRAVGGVR